MTRDEIDILWNRAMAQAVKDGEMFTRYEFAKLVAASEREAIESALTDPENQPSQWGTVTIEHMEQQVTAEREACAKVCYEESRRCSTLAARSMLMEAAVAIRARSKE